MSKRFFAVAAVSLLVLSLGVTSAYAEGYNTTGEYTPANGYKQGPHGGYTTTTNKCSVCHSTHYAAGSYMLLRANSREAACDFCHGGGGGSSINVQMDNDYKSSVVASAGVGDAVAITSATNGMGTGHTLGFTGKAPGDVEPAYSDTAGLACFDCHTPHGNSARVLQPFGSPSHPAGAGYVTEVYGVPFMFAQIYRLQESMHIKFDGGQLFTPSHTPSNALYTIPEDFTQANYGGGPAFLKWSGAATKIEDVINNNANLAYNTGLPMGPLATSGTELAGTLANFGGWSGIKAPTQAAIGAWYGTYVAPQPTGADGYKPVTPAAFGALMDVFAGGDGTGTGTDATLINLFSSWNVYYGTDVDEGNIDTAFMNMGNWQFDSIGNNLTTPGTYAPVAPPELEVWHKPLFPKGRFLLLKNPDSQDDYSTAVNDMGMPSPDFKTAGSGTTANAANGKKVAIDWEWPLGPAASWGPYFYTDNNERFALNFPWAPKGVAMENEMCTSCHDGAAGQSNQAAKVYNGVESTYTVSYSHDSNSRGCARAQYLNPNDGNNFGPHCANCHTGASGCYTCHDADGENWESFGEGAYAQIINGTFVDPTAILYEGRSGYQAPASLKSSAVGGVGAKCLDGGFSYPHRTLGSNMLKDELWGVDFDGSAIAPGQVRSSQAAAQAAYGAGFFNTSFEATSQIAGKAAENLDSACIDCHGDAKSWNGDNPDYFVNFNSGDPLGNATWNVQGWELLLKGLP